VPKYKLPPPQGPEQAVEAPVRVDYSYPDEWARRITIPVDDAILAAMQVGGEVEITLKGTLDELTNSDSTVSGGRKNITVSITEVEAYMEDGAEEEYEEDAFAGGFNRSFAKPGRMLRS